MLGTFLVAVVKLLVGSNFLEKGLLLARRFRTDSPPWQGRHGADKGAGHSAFEGEDQSGSE